MLDLILSFCWSMELVLALCGRNRREGTELDLVVLCCLNGEGVFFGECHPDLVALFCWSREGVLS